MRNLRTKTLHYWLKSVFVGVLVSSQLNAEGFYEVAPIEYSKTAPDNVIEKLNELTRGESYQSQKELLLVLLKVLKIPVESQVLVFSKTSAQKTRISQKYPRAIYFNDSTYLAFVQGGDFEVITHDDKLGLVFYTVGRDFTKGVKNKLAVTRHESCLDCHVSSTSHEVPGLFLRSVSTDEKGETLFAKGHHNVTDELEISKRWGGWYVTGKWGSDSHMGNAHTAAFKLQELENLNQVIDTSAYPKSTSDLVALMVLEHQCKIHNRLVSSKFHYQRARYLSSALDPDIKERDEETSSFKMAGHLADKIVAELLFKNEAVLDEKNMQGGGAFTRVFEQAGVKNRRGKSLRRIRLYHRLFTYRCSYMIYSQAFASLPDLIKEKVYQKLYIGLKSEIPEGAFKHLSKRERKKIFDILAETSPLEKYKPS